MRHVPWLRVGEVVADALGLHFPPERLRELRRGFEGAARELGLGDADRCAAAFLAAPSRPPMREALAAHLTIGETYFFRDPPAFDALRAWLEPLVHERRAGARRLRLWSAGCCTGEEAYSLAILLQGLLPDLGRWDATVLATDVNPRFLEKAAAGSYGAWSFRGQPPAFRARHFTRAGDRDVVRPEIRRLVRFASLNLADESTAFPAAVDAIFCRNVLMYFTPPKMRRVVARLRDALLPAGALVVSPSESAHALFPGFVAMNDPGALFYVKEPGRAIEGAAA